MSTNTPLSIEEASHDRPLLTLAIATSTIMMCVMAFAVVARITAKAFVVKKIHLEDCKTRMFMSKCAVDS